ncbi:Cof-type HAD-IIB family hydrolase [Marinilactibacillus sp. XAAS-LB27]|uniref:Cof-type HAD-IIB family hydrolase n=1 Tax=Marinilactibacillus sp. XAAS-LB27 TaxID=3114538 RepID=UPI002E16FD0C|nr:Cof-type HAD-IIB family hydrolase [Marinilactibacillus sp. XAAS-LB27]
MKKVVFFDIDGTLVSSQNHVPDSTKRAIKALKQQGILPVIATGRATVLLEEVRKELEIDSYIAMNGQLVVLEGVPIFTNPLPQDVLSRLMEKAAQDRKGIVLCGTEDIYSNSFISLVKRSSVLSVLKHIGKLIPNRIQMSLFSRLIRKPPKPEDFEGKDICQVLLELNKKEETAYKNQFKELHFTRSNDYTADVISAGISKATGIDRIIQELGIDIQDTYAFGDSLNDLEMIQHVGTGVSMGNGWKELKQVADMITEDVSEDGIEIALKKLNLIP